MQVGRFFVNRVSSHKISKTVTFQGEEATADVTEVQIELIDESGQHGSARFSFHKSAEVEAAKLVAVEGGYITLSMDGPSTETV
jgi:hypothetical protein